MIRIITAYGAGLLFGLGLVVSQMISPAKVLAFLDVAGNWDPSLAVVLFASVFVAAVGYPIVLKGKAPLFDEKFRLPEKQDIDRKLLTGAGIFGIGWGLSGYCPGPALTAISLAEPKTGLFLLAMAAGWGGTRLITGQR